MESQIKTLERQSRNLEIKSKQRKEILQKAEEYAEHFLEGLPGKPAYNSDGRDGDNISGFSFDENPKPLDELLDILEKEVDSRGLNPASGKHVGYIPGGGIYPSAIADFLAAVTNRYAGVFFSSPGAVRIENKCIRWMCDLVGYPTDASGNLTSGGSIANLIGLVTARDNSGISSPEYDRCTIYTTRQVHHCLIKAVKFAGLGEAKIREIGMDEGFRMKADLLEQRIREDKEQGLKPLVIFASAGTTDLGAIDPLDDIADAADTHDIWFHVDAAYGGFFLLTGHGKKKMEGIDRSDSLTIDPHKGLFLPYGSGALLVREGQKLFDSQHMTANYLQDTYAVGAEPSPADLSPELSKHFRGLRMWLPLQLFGIKPFRAALEEKLLLARYFYLEIQKTEGIEVGPQPELSVMFFRYVPNNGDANTFNKRLVQKIQEDGRVFLSSTLIGKVVYLRLAVLSFRTHLEEVDHVLEVVREKIEEVKRTTSMTDKQTQKEQRK